MKINSNILLQASTEREETVHEKHVVNIETVIDYIETNLNGKIDLEQVSEAVHYSKYHFASYVHEHGRNDNS